MDSAHSGDLVPIAAKDIGKIEGWQDLNWYCLSCPVPVVPVACDPDETFRKVPHFSLNKSGRDKHAQDCDVAGLNLLIKKARKKPIQSNDILLGHLPYSVVFRDSVRAVEERGVKPGGGPGNNVSSAGSEGGKPTRFHRPSRSSIESICRAHAAMKDSEFRETQLLNVEGCLGSNYRDTFYQLQNSPGGDPPKLRSCIFYGELRFRAKPNYRNPEKLILILNRWVRSDEHGEHPYRLIIRWQDWRDQLRRLFCARGRNEASGNE